MAGQQPTEGTSSGRYEQLQQRAYLFIRDSDGAVLEETLIGHVFGSGGNPSLWRSLLRQVLQGDDRLSLRGDGYWALRTASPQADRMPTDFVVLDVETTGLKPYRQRLIEVAAIRYRGGLRQDLFSTLINPERRVPSYISRLTGIDDVRLAAAPLFRDVGSGLLQFLGEDLIVGYNVGFDVGFIDAELKRLGRQPLINERLDLLPLSQRLVPNLRRSGLDSVCHALGIETRERHRAETDAEVTAVVMAHLIGLARERGMTSLESLRRVAALDVPTPKRRESVGRGRAVLDKSHLEGIPKKPGVYIMRDVHGRVIYVGKAKNLRNRVSSYYSQPLGYTRKMDGLLESIERIEVVETGSELEALLLEAQFIQRYSPQFNTQQRHNESYPYIKIDIDNPWPRVMVTRRREADDAVYFGPFRIGRAAKDVVELINEVYGLRTCTRTFRTAKSLGSPCLQLALGRCPGPCVGAADPDQYRHLIHEVIDFLHGERDEVFERLHSQLRECAERLDFERAARLRDRIRRVQHLVLSQQLLDETSQHGDALIVTPSPVERSRELMLVVGGRRWAQLRLAPTDDGVMIAERLAASWLRAIAANDRRAIEQASLDEVQILGRWLRKHAGHPAILPLSGTDVNWGLLVGRAQRLRDEELSFDQPQRSDEIDADSDPGGVNVHRRILNETQAMTMGGGRRGAGT